MGTGKTYSTDYLVDSNNNTGVAGQVLISTSTGIDWSNGSDIIGGPYLPLSAGVNFPLTGGLYGISAFFSSYIKLGGYSYIGEDLTETDSLTIASDNTESIFFAHHYPATSTYTTTMEISPSGELKMPMAADGDKLTIQGSSGANNNIIEIGQIGSDGYLSVSAAGGGIVTHLSGYTGTASYFLSNVGIGNTTVGAKLDISGSSGTISVRVKGDMGTGAYYYGYMFDGTNLKGTTQTNIFHAGDAVIAADTTITDYAGLRIEAPNVSNSNAVVTNNYGIYQASNLQKNYFGGNVGIGTELPSNLLSLKGAGNNYSTSAAIKFWDSTYSKGWYVGTANNDVAGDFYIRSVTAEAAYPVAADQQFTIKQTGNVGIGLLAPGAKLDVLQEARISYANANQYTLRITNTDGNPRILADGSAAHLIFGTTPNGSATATERLRIQNDGNVGIGTTLPASKLEVSGRISGGQLGNPKITRQGLGLYVDFNDKACISGLSGTEKPIDLGPNNYDLTLLGGANFEYLNGIGTFYFDGSNDRIQVNSFNVPDTTNSYEIWHYAVSQNTYETWWDSGNERPLLGTYNNYLIAYPAYSGSALGTTIDTGKWYHVVWAFNGNNDLDIFVNGVRVHEALGGTIAQRTGTFDAWLGGDQSAETTNGFIAIARTYTRQLTLDDVLQNYNAEVSMFAGVNPSLGIVQAGGNVGIGINEGIDANLRVDANSGTLTQEILKVKGGGSGGNFGFLVEANNGDDLFKVDTFSYNSFFPNGKVMVGGTSAPSGNLTVESAGNQFHLRANTATAGKYWNFDVTSANQLYIINNGGGQYITIKDNGFVGINDSTPTNVLDVDGDIRGTEYKLRGNVANPTDTAATIYDQSTVGLTLSAHNISFRNYNGTAMVESARLTYDKLTVVGDVIAYGTPSDKRLKENVKPIDSALDKAMKLQGVTFDWKESDSILDIKEDIGFIAQDVQKVLPELVRENKDGMLSMRHQGIAPILLEAIKELKAEIEDLKKKIK